MSWAKQLLLDESGLETVEWATAGGGVVAVTAALLIAIGLDVARGMTALDAETNNIP